MSTSLLDIPEVGTRAWELIVTDFYLDVEVQPNGCWYWTGRITDSGYPQVGRCTSAYRRSFALLRGTVPSKQQLDHTCHTRDKNCRGGPTCLHRRCVNPYHLEPVTNRENVLRSRSFAATKAKQTHCDDGHEFTPENTRIRKNGTRNCIKCARRRCRESYRRVRAR